MIGNVVYKAEEYPQLKDFYQKVNGKDKEPAVLQLTQAASELPRRLPSESCRLLLIVFLLDWRRLRRGGQPISRLGGSGGGGQAAVLPAEYGCSRAAR